ncbi:hypothetical protein HHK36_022941 [Tetracentron sinense]|uniref:Ubiquitin-like protease family profile domain-containing protein n=1 Tax=Tetracentron sinense TaxID=13715 RepID=A0A835D795_TETSI|nr:hypothetical protein HHK36_022941 [Tetracentron sinense]
MDDCFRNRKRVDDCISFTHLFSSPNSLAYYRRTDLHISNNPRISIQISPNNPASSKSLVSRIGRYPPQTQRFRREVHAPCRKHKSGFTVSSCGESRFWARVCGMGNCFGSSRHDPVESFAKETYQNLRKDKEVIDVEDDVSEDSSVEIVEKFENVREERSVVSNQRYWQNNGDVLLQEEYAEIAGFGDLQPHSLAVSELANTTQNVEDVGKMMESLSVDSEVEIVGIVPYKKPHKFADSRNSKSGSLGSQNWLSLFPLPAAEKSEEEAPFEPFAPLTDEEQAEVSQAFSSPNRRVLVTHENSNVDITGEILRCLRPHGWLNDEVINVYLELLKEREQREPKKFLKCHFFNTFFYKKLISGSNGYDFKAVRRWTTQRKIGYDLLECDKIFVPVHKEIHWCLAVINIKDEKFQYLDSFKGKDTQVLKVLARYFVNEVKDKSGKEININSWKREYVDNLPDQKNGWDCGMFMVKYADFYSRGLGLCFKQEHMPYFRRRTAKEILRLKAE